MGIVVTKFDMFCMIGCFMGVYILITSKDKHSDSKHSQMDQLTGLIFIFVSAISYSFVGVITRRLKEVHFSVVMFHYSLISSLMLGAYVLGEHYIYH
jgi:drug/metabolite transporter (DMT)-like permease